jgi:hypothetical protein
VNCVFRRVTTQPASQPSSRSYFARIQPWLALLGVGGVIPLLGWLWRALNPVGAVDVTVLVRDEAFMQLPAVVDSLPLRLTYGSAQFRKAMVFDAVVANTGSEPIGSSGRWQITLRHPDRRPLLQLSQVRRIPARIGDSVHVTASEGSVRLDIGLLNPRDEVAIRLLALEHPDEYRWPVTADVSPIPRLRRVAVERGSAISALHSRVVGRLGLPIMVLAFLLLMTAWVREQRAIPGASLIKSLPGAVLLMLLGSVFVAFGLAWLVAWLGVLALRLN